MTIIMGLGNPGKKFKNTRHNAGFEVLDFFAKKNQFPDFEFSKKYDALISENENVILVKPQTFMNESGITAKKLMSNVNCQMLIVIHDDIDLPLGKLKIVKDRGFAGHKGVESIMQGVDSGGLIRFRVGIASDNQLAEKVVLKKFSREEQKVLDDVIEKTSEALKFLIENGVEKTMNKYN